MNRDQLTPPAGDQPTPTEGIRPYWSSFGKRLLISLLGVGFVLLIIILIVAAARPSLIESALTNLERTLPPKTAPRPPSPAKISEHTVEAPSATTLQQAPPSTDSQAQNFWAEFEKSAWGVPLQDWSRLHADIPCEPFRGRMVRLGADAQWSHRCSTTRKPEAAHWSFYVFGLQEPLVARLEQFDVTTATLSEEALGDFQSLLRSRIAARFGPGEDRSGPKAVLTHQVSWPRNLRWQAPDLEIQLDVVEFDPQRKEGRLRLQGRHRALLEALNEDIRLQSVGTSDYSYAYYRTGSGIDAQLADNLRPDFADVATMLMKDQPDPNPQELVALQQKQRDTLQEQLQQQLQKQRQAALAPGQTRAIGAIAVGVPQAVTYWKAKEFHGALEHLLMAVKTSSPDRQPILLWAADRLAERLPSLIADDKSHDADWDKWQAQLAPFGVTYVPSSDADGPLTYTGGLLKRVWTDYGQTDWGERAFLVLQSHGWDMGPACEAGSDQFRAVIQQGLPFLEQHPKSPYQLDAVLTVAQAYETWWSLSQAQATTGSDDSENVDPRKYQPGAEEARQKAIAFYERLLQIAPQSDHAAYARRQSPRLKLGIDTGQRRFYCFYWD
jgi:hypothetical protein